MFRSKKSKTKWNARNFINIEICWSSFYPRKRWWWFKKTNQDSYVLEKNINGILNYNIFGVLDAHGDNGQSEIFCSNITSLSEIQDKFCFSSSFFLDYGEISLINYNTPTQKDDPEQKKEMLYKLQLNEFNFIS